MKELKPKKCKNCKDLFQPERPLQYLCNNGKCVYEYADKSIQKKNMDLLKERTKTKTEWHNEFQKEINTIVRLIDKGHECISSRRPIPPGQANAGHLYSVKSNPGIRYNLFNIYAQSIEQNQHKGGSPLEYVEGLEYYFGKEHKEFVLNLKYKYPCLKVIMPNVKEGIQKAKAIIKWLKLQDRQFTTEERLLLREKFNQELNIYK